ncbi:acyl-[acyl-carrier-protein] thioesterase [Lentilactobacillus sp. SPB1-3]|uniref:Acyl-[acyl-carrier-protein] thioesterase n=1 Tax=Lentilactobacillus terminaliae TaxID=3003483 RepID=A0ACD5DHA9_9LACO|nr:acyl-ACP thioesterase domain-containing protein [Lentilactobacillus sp. SPB1-3]MCZ0976923.1 thioesterase [Lentilactobacillus sp. SPB1-3]
MTAKKFSETHTVPYYEGNITNHITLAMLLNIVILVSEHQNEILGVDHNELINNYGIGWVVTSYSIKINELPKIDQTIKLTTRGTSYNKYFAYREFWIENEDGEELVKIDSIWVLINEETRKVSPIDNDLIALYESENVKRLPRLPRPEKLGDELDSSKKYQVRINDIDFNGHVNNAHYMDWMLDVFSIDFITSHKPVQVDIRFENEVTYGSWVESSVKIEAMPDGLTKTVHRIDSGNEVSAIATIIWGDIK